MVAAGDKHRKAHTFNASVSATTARHLSSDTGALDGLGLIVAAGPLGGVSAANSVRRTGGEANAWQRDTMIQGIHTIKYKCLNLRTVGWEAARAGTTLPKGEEVRSFSVFVFTDIRAWSRTYHTAVIMEGNT